MNLEKKNLLLKKKYKKLIFVISNLSLGGAERQLCILINYLQDNYSITLITTSDTNKDFFKLRKKNLKRVKLYKRENINFFKKLVLLIHNILKIRKEIHKIKAHVVISFLPVPSIMTLMAAYGIKIKKIVSIRNNPFEDFKNLNFFFKLLYLFFQKKIDILIVQTKSLKNNLKKLYFDNKIFVVSNFLPLLNDKYHLKKKFQFLKVDPYFLFVGKMTKQKGLDILLSSYEAYMIKNKNKKKCNLYILTNSKNVDYDYFKYIKKKINKSHYKKNIKIFFNVKDISHWYKHCRAYILSSRYEGYPNSLVEAKYYGCNIISFNCKYGPKEILHNYSNKMIVKRESVSGLTLAMHQNNFLQQRKSRLSINKIKNFNIKVLKKWISIVLN